jgi:hypothetical protein
LNFSPTALHENSGCARAIPISGGERKAARANETAINRRASFILAAEVPVRDGGPVYIEPKCARHAFSAPGYQRMSAAKLAKRHNRIFDRFASHRRVLR